MNRKLKSLLAAACGVVLLAGCDASGVPNINPENIDPIDPTGLSISDTTNCAVPVSGLCLLGGDSHPGGLVDVLLSSNGPFGPIAGAIDTEALVDALTVLLASDDGTLAGILRGLFREGQLQEGLRLLLVGDGDGRGALAETLVNLLRGNEEGEGLLQVLIGLGDGGPVALLNALLLSGFDTACQAPLGRLCLVGDGVEQFGLLDVLLTSGGVLGAVSPTVTQEVLDGLVDSLGDLLESNGSLVDLVRGLIARGQLIEGVRALLFGADGMGLLGILTTTLGGLGDIVGDVTGFLFGLFRS